MQQGPLCLTDVLRRDANNFGLLRLIAAFCIIIGHAHAISPQTAIQDTVLSILHYDYSSSLALNFFFFLSGLLLTDSLIRQPYPLIFLVRRMLRIFPGLIVCLLISVFIIGPLFTKLALLDFFRDQNTWNYLLQNVRLVGYKMSLPGVFNDSQFGLNGSLWSLRYEVMCYLYAAILSGCGLFSIRIATNLFCVVVIALAFMAPDVIPRFGANSAAYMLPACFALGTLFAMNKQMIKIDLSRVVLIWVLMWLFNEPNIQRFFCYLAIFYTSLYIGSLKVVVNRLKLPFDASYGVFIYGFMIQQCVHVVFPTMGIYGNQCLSIIVALLMGIASWYLVEQPAIQFGRKMNAMGFAKNREREQVAHFVKKTREMVLRQDNGMTKDEVS